MMFSKPVVKFKMGKNKGRFIFILFVENNQGYNLFMYEKENYVARQSNTKFIYTFIKQNFCLTKSSGAFIH